MSTYKKGGVGLIIAILIVIVIIVGLLISAFNMGGKDTNALPSNASAGYVQSTSSSTQTNNTNTDSSSASIESDLNSQSSASLDSTTY